MKNNKSLKNELIRFTMLGLALAVFFIGPRFIQSDVADDVADTLHDLKEHKLPARVIAPVVRQLNECAEFGKEHSGSVAVMGVKMSAVNWLALLILISGLFTPIILKYIDSKKKPGDA